VQQNEIGALVRRVDPLVAHLCAAEGMLILDLVLREHLDAHHHESKDYLEEYVELHLSLKKRLEHIQRLKA
jgi:hypothetical protein